MIELSENLIGFELAQFLHAEKCGFVRKFTVFSCFFGKRSAKRWYTAARSAAFEARRASSEARRAEQRGPKGRVRAGAVYAENC